MVRLSVAPTIVMAAVLLLTAACTGSDEPGATPTPTPSATTSATAPASESAAPGGAGLTAQGSELAVGDRATVSWQPRAGVEGVLEVRVTALERAPITALAAFDLDRTQRGSSLYYVKGRVENVGDSDLAGVGVPLYVVNDRDQLVEATPVGAAFEPCASAPLPTPFAAGDRTSFCLLYLLPERGSLEAVSFRPYQDFDPVTWTGPIGKARPTP